MNLRETFRATIEKYEMLRPGEGVLVAVSGGPDSVALLHVLRDLRKELRLRLEVAHLQHGIRGEEAAEDARFVAALAKRLKLPFHVREVDLPRIRSSRGKGNLEAMAREERYRFFASIARERGIEKVATAHTLDDQAETVLMWLLRGTGRRGLGGMPPVQSLKRFSRDSSTPLLLVRPLIDASRAEVTDYLRASGIRCRSDSTNLDYAYLRNWIRLEWLPALRERFGANLSSRLAQLAELWRDEERILDRLAAERLRQIKSGEIVSRALFLREEKSLQRRVLRLWIEEALGDLRRIDFRHVEDALLFIAQGPPQGRLAIPRGWDLVREYEELRLERRKRKRKPVCYSYALRLGGELTVREAGMKIRSSRRRGSSRELPESDMEALFDFSALFQPLVVRNFRHGDRFQPLGMSGHKKLKDFFIERKIPLPIRTILPLITMGAEVLWIPGYGRSEIGKIGPKTKDILRLEAFRRQF